MKSVEQWKKFRWQVESRLDGIEEESLIIPVLPSLIGVGKDKINNALLDRWNNTIFHFTIEFLNFDSLILQIPSIHDFRRMIILLRVSKICKFKRFNDDKVKKIYE